MKRPAFFSNSTLFAYLCPKDSSTHSMLPQNFLSQKIGILGGGQLGLMMAQSAADLHIEPIFLDPDPKASVKPFGQVQRGDFRDYDTVMAFGLDKDLISFEIEGVNLEALRDLEKKGKKVCPGSHVLEVIRNKYYQKKFLDERGFPTPPFVSFEKGNAKEYLAFLPSFWKQNEGGYDGKGVQKVLTEADLQAVPDLPGFLEKAVAIEKELAVIIARNENGEIRAFPPVEQVFHPGANLVSYLQTPAFADEAILKQCIKMAEELVVALKMTGLMAVEFFIDTSGKVWVNEMAPRPHNSGHHSIEGFQTSQFNQFWRAILNLPLGITEPLFPFSAMVNLIGAENHSGTPVYQGITECLALPGVHIHLYGKSETRPFRKMGHATITAQTFEELNEKVSFVQKHFTIISSDTQT